MWNCGERWTGEKRRSREGQGAVRFCLFHPLDNRGTGLTSRGDIPDSEQPSSGRCQVPKCQIWAPRPHPCPPKKGSSLKILLVNRWIEGDLKLRLNSERAVPQLRCSRTKSSFLSW